MGLLTIIRKSNYKDKQLRVLFLGLDNSGKSTIVKRLLKAPNWQDLSPTLGFDIQSLSYQGFTLNIWDIGGQKTLRPYWRNYFERTDGLIWVIDSYHRERMSECREELWNLMVAEDRLASCSLLVLANKQDIPGAMSLEEIGAALDLDELMRTRKGDATILACSAVQGRGYEEGLSWLVQDCKKRLYWSASQSVEAKRASIAARGADTATPT
ncbi:unnamed protein product [Jaminaea pallidilutea]